MDSRHQRGLLLAILAFCSRFQTKQGVGLITRRFPVAFLVAFLPYLQTCIATGHWPLWLRRLYLDLTTVQAVHRGDNRNGLKNDAQCIDPFFTDKTSAQVNRWLTFQLSIVGCLRCPWWAPASTTCSQSIFSSFLESDLKMILPDIWPESELESNSMIHIYYYPHMPIGKVWVYRFLFFVILWVCLYGFLSQKKLVASNFAGRFIGIPAGNLPYLWTLLHQKPKIGRIGQCVKTMNVPFGDSTAWRVRRIGMCGYTAVSKDGRTCYYYY